MIETGPTGSVVKGSIWDCSMKAFQRAIKAYDSKLYVKWNPKKNNGYGMWELWREPNDKTWVEVGELNGEKILAPIFITKSLVHHVLDMPFLTTNVVSRLREMDAWENKNFAKQLDEQVDAHEEKVRRQRDEERRAYIREERKYLKEFKELVQSGYNPFWFLK